VTTVTSGSVPAGCRCRVQRTTSQRLQTTINVISSSTERPTVASNRRQGVAHPQIAGGWKLGNERGRRARWRQGGHRITVVSRRSHRCRIRRRPRRPWHVTQQHDVICRREILTSGDKKRGRTAAGIYICTQHKKTALFLHMTLTRCSKTH